MGPWYAIPDYFAQIIDYTRNRVVGPMSALL